MHGRSSRCLAAALLASWCALPAAARAAGVAPTFGTDRPEAGPFPSDLFTVADGAQRTGLRVLLPYPTAFPTDLFPGGFDCSAPVPEPRPSGYLRPSDCDDVDLLNQLDGFNVRPRISIPFTGAIDPRSATGGVFVVEMGDAADAEEIEHGAGDAGSGESPPRVIGVRDVVWDQASSTLHVETAEQLEQHFRYVVVVTRGVRTPSGTPIDRSPDFARFRRDLAYGQTKDEHLKWYRRSLLQGLDAAEGAGIAEEDVAAASVFTTMSVTALVEKLHAQVRAAPPPARADFHLLRDPVDPAGNPGPALVFALDDIAGLSWDRGATPNPQNPSLDARIAQLRLVPGVGRVAFGKYASPIYLRSEGAIPTVPTRTGSPQVQRTEDVYFNLFLPAGAPPSGGWPVVIVGHGQGNSKNDIAFTVAAKLASHGLASIAINMVAHGFRPLAPGHPELGGTLTLRKTSGEKVTFSAGGRGVDVNNDKIVGNVEGNTATGPYASLVNAHTRLQTSVDLMQLVRVIEAGVVVDDAEGVVLDPSRIYSLGFSAGSYVSASLFVVEPAIRAAVFNGTLASVTNFRLDPANRGAVGNLLAARVPSLVNPPGLGAICGVAVPASAIRFDENLPLRCASADPVEPITKEVPGAMALQQYFDRVEWLTEVSALQAMAPYFRKAPLVPGLVRPVLVQFARGDRTDVNPNTAAVVRAGALEPWTTCYRHDLWQAAHPTGPIVANPHRFLVNVDEPNPALAAGARDLALRAQEQAAHFLATGGEIIDPDDSGPGGLFDVPAEEPIPEDLGFVF